jgi:hypothetical protein
MSTHEFDPLPVAARTLASCPCCQRQYQRDDPRRNAGSDDPTRGMTAHRIFVLGGVNAWDRMRWIVTVELHQDLIWAN